MKWIEHTETIKQSVTVPMLLSKMGIETSRRRRIPCPVHRGENDNFCYTDKVYYCFSCGAKGDVIGLFMSLENVSFSDACSSLNDMFSLRLSDHITLAEKRRRDRLYKEKAKQQEKLLLQKKCSEEAYKRLLAYYRWLLEQEKTPEILSDIAYMDRLFELYNGKDTLIEFDADARITALISKHKGGDTFWNLMNIQ